MGILIYLVAVLIGLPIIVARRRHALADQSPLSFGLVILLLVIVPLQWSFEIALSEHSFCLVPVALLLIGVILLVEPGKLSHLYLDNKRLGLSLLEGSLISLFVIVPFFVSMVYAREGQVLWLPADKIPIYLLNVVQIVLVEELTFRSLLLGYLRRFSFSPAVANSLQTACFGLGHLSYLASGDWLLLGFAFTFGFLAGWMTLRRENVAGALLAHTVANFVPLLLNNGSIPSL